MITGRRAPRGARSACPLALLLLLGPLAPPPAASPGDEFDRAGGVLVLGDVRLAVNGAGVITAVPEGGLVTVDGPQVQLSPSPAPQEWAGIAFDTPQGHVTAVACGNAADWAGRESMTATSFALHDGGAVSVMQAGPLRITTTYSIDALGPYLIGDVALLNTGDTVLRNVLYTREWNAGGEAGFTFPDLPGMAAAPAQIARRVWMQSDLRPGESGGAGFSWRSAATPAPGALGASVSPGDGAPDVPLQLFVNADFPTGFTMPGTNGVSFGDYDADGFTDIFVCQSGNLYRNVDGATWKAVADLDSVLPPANRRYGSSFGDYDQDGWPDIGTEPRDNFGGDECFHLLHDGDASVPAFTDAAIDPQVLDLQPCGANSETICWADVDGDGRLDMFLPVYPPWAFNGPGNFFLHNLGPAGAGLPWHFSETSAAAGLDNPPGSARPEGACFVDTDGDGDLDLYSNGTLYQNDSQPGAPHFTPMNTTGSGIGNSSILDEGALLFDYDMDGDMDLAIVYTPAAWGVRLWESRGDGTFFGAETSIIDSFQIGLDLGLSAEDWDGDGDIDFSTRQVFRRNRVMEDGVRHFTVATHAIPNGQISSATPAWGDMDHDGDLDCALGNWLKAGHFYANTTYGPDTPPEARRFVRVRVMRDDALLDRGLETEYGAVVDLTLVGDLKDETGLDGLPRRRRKFTCSAGGYLNQNEYVLTFALPQDPTPGEPVTDLAFDLRVDFPQLGGLWRVDKFVNPLLGGIQLAQLADREIAVFRSGRVSIGGCDARPLPAAEPMLITSALPSGLLAPSPSLGLPEPQPAPGPDTWAGLAFSTGQASPMRVKQILVDGQLAPPTACGADLFDLLLWDVTDPLAPVLVPFGALAAGTSGRNRRTDVPVDMVLAPGRNYRLVAHLSELRATPVAAPLVQGNLTLQGGLLFSDADPCSGLSAAGAGIDPGQVWLAVRVAPDLGTRFTDLGGALAGGQGTPVLSAAGTLEPGSALAVTLTSAQPFAAATIVMGHAAMCAPFKGGTLVPVPDLGLEPMLTDGAGALTVSTTWPGGVPAGFTVYVQTWIADPAAPEGFSASNGVSLTTPF